MAGVERWDFYIPSQHEEPDSWNILGRTWLTDCGHLSDAEFIAAIEAHRADPEHGMFQPATADVNRHADRLRQRDTQRAQADKQAASRQRHHSRVIAPKEAALTHIANMRLEAAKALAERNNP